MKSRIKTMVLLGLVVLIGVFPLVFLKNAEFSGADSKAQEAISEINKNYKPWFSSPFKPASDEIESLMFALQAAIGSGILFYGLGYMRGCSKTEEKYELLKRQEK